MTVVVLGAGFLGHRLAAALPGSELSRVDVTDRDGVRGFIRATGATAVVNAAGKTGKPNVDWCESHPVETYRANVVGALSVAEVCQREGVYLLHLSSGCIFYGEPPTRGGWLEGDFANPVSFYSRTKYAADLALGSLPNTGIVRVRMPVDSVPGPRNLITKLAKYEEVIDVENSVTVVDDFLQVAVELIARRAAGIFHATNPGIMRHADLLALYRELVDPAHTTRLIDAAELVQKGLALKPRSNCVLASPRLAAIGIAMRPIGLALRATMEQYARATRCAGLLDRSRDT